MRCEDGGHFMHTIARKLTEVFLDLSYDRGFYERHKRECHRMAYLLSYEVVERMIGKDKCNWIEYNSDYMRVFIDSLHEEKERKNE